MHVSIRLALGVGAFVALHACGGNGSPTAPPPPQQQQQNPTVTSVSITGGNAVTVGQTVQLSATANMSNNTTQNVSSTATWSSSNTGAATISNTGLATGVAAGTTEIRAAFQGTTGTAQLQVNAPAATPPVAQFTVSGPGGTDVCRIIEDSGGDLDCTFNGAASSGGSGGAVTQWIWRYDVGTNSAGPITDDDPEHTPVNLCGFFANKPNQTGTGFVQMIVKLQVRNAAGTLSSETRNSNVRLFPQKQCGFVF
jgi:hypothetical protein